MNKFYEVQSHYTQIPSLETMEKVREILVELKCYPSKKEAVALIRRFVEVIEETDTGEERDRLMSGSLVLLNSFSVV